MRAVKQSSKANSYRKNFYDTELVSIPIPRRKGEPLSGIDSNSSLCFEFCQLFWEPEGVFQDLGSVPNKVKEVAKSSSTNGEHVVGAVRVPAHPRTGQELLELLDTPFNSSRANGEAFLSKLQILHPALMTLKIEAKSARFGFSRARRRTSASRSGPVRVRPARAERCVPFRRTSSRCRRRTVSGCTRCMRSRSWCSKRWLSVLYLTVRTARVSFSIDWRRGGCGSRR